MAGIRIDALSKQYGDRHTVKPVLDALSAELVRAARDFDADAALDLFMQRMFPAG